MLEYFYYYFSMNFSENLQCATMTDFSPFCKIIFQIIRREIYNLFFSARAHSRTYGRTQIANNAAEHAVLGDGDRAGKYIFNNINISLFSICSADCE